MVLKMIVSGGQTGVDRGALDAALEAGFPCGGWCPRDRKAEDGTIPERYPLAETVSANYRSRTIKNVSDSDGTAIVYFGELSGGTEETKLHCERLGKPYFLIDASEVTPDHGAELLAAFVDDCSIETLNVAGPRASKEPAAHAYARDFVRLLIP